MLRMCKLRIRICSPILRSYVIDLENVGSVNPEARGDEVMGPAGSKLRLEMGSDHVPTSSRDLRSSRCGGLVT